MSVIDHYHCSQIHHPLFRNALPGVRWKGDLIWNQKTSRQGKAMQGKVTIDIIDARTEDWIGQFIIIYNK